MRSQTIEKSNTIKKSVRLMSILAVVFLVLLAGYFFVVRPLLVEEGAPQQAVVCDPIWESEVASVNGRVLMYPHYERENILKVSIHNPRNAVYGKHYVDWGFHQYTGPEDNPDGLYPGDFYLTNFEYAPFDSALLSNVVIGAGYTLAVSRVEDHCTDYSRYGLDYATPEDAVSVTMETTDGKSYTYYIGDKIPSGSGYYVRVVGKDVLKATGESIERDSVYVLSPSNLEAALLVNPVKLVTPTLTLPVDTQSMQLLDSFLLTVCDTPYINADGTGFDPMIELYPVDAENDPFAQYAGLGVYYAASHPGYFASTRFESLTSLFADFQGDEVLELGTLMKDSEGEDYYGFDYATLEKYHLTPGEYKYEMTYTFQEIESGVFFSPLQEGSYYYAYAPVFNTICKISAEKAYFLQWEEQAFLMNQLVYLAIDKCDSVKINGSYFGSGIAGDRVGLQTVNEIYQLSGTGSNLLVNTADGKTLNAKQFRTLYEILISIANRGEVSDQEVAELMKKDPVASIEVSTRRSVVYVVNEQGVSTTEIDYIQESVSKKFNFYELSDGRLFCTIQSIDAEGKASAETGSFYVLSARLEQLFRAAQDLREDKPIDKLDRY